MISFILILFVVVLLVNYILLFVCDFGVSDGDIVILVMVVFVCDFVSRFCFVFIVDSKILKRYYILVVSMFMNGLVCFFVLFYIIYFFLMVYFVVYGVFG